MEIENTFWVLSSYGNRVMWHFCNFTQPDGIHLMPCLINLTSCTHAFPLSLSHIFFFLFKHTWIKPNLFKESTLYQNQTYSKANYSNLKQNPAQKHKFGLSNNLIKLQNLENLLYIKKKRSKRDLGMARHSNGMRNIVISHVQLSTAGKTTESTLSSAMSNLAR